MNKPADREWITVLGATGSIGESTLRVIEKHPERFAIHALTANTNVSKMLELCEKYHPEVAVMHDESAARSLEAQLRTKRLSIEVLSGMEGLEAVASAAPVSRVMAAIVGSIGLAPTLAAARAGKTVLLANKEALVMAGSLFMAAAEQHGATVLPIDSEHNAIFQCLPVTEEGRIDHSADKGIYRIQLTGSGGPFLNTPLAELETVTPDQACAHPNWSMGRKISVDSATMLNKALELIEACHLFGVDQSRIDIVIHPQSIIHSLVSYTDGSVLAQLGNPDMRTPVAYGLAWPHRLESGVTSLDLVDVARLDFLEPDLRRFPCLQLGREAAASGGNATVVLNAANEVAVAAFLDGIIGFTAIPAIIADLLALDWPAAADSLEQVLATDNEVRLRAKALLKKYARQTNL